jgi:uncharacterized Zn-binding protein involved in type VI secretion
MPMGPAARILDPVVHPAPGMLTPGPGSPDVIIGNKLAWRGVPAGAAAAISSAKQASDTTIKAAEAATVLAAGTPGAPAAKAAEETTKATAAATMGSMITGAAGGADIHNCLTPLPIPPHGPGVVIDGSPTVLINGLPACRQGDTIIEAVGPPDKILLGLFTVIIGNVPNTASGNAPGSSPGGGGSSALAKAADQVNPTNSTQNCGYIIDAVVARLRGTNPSATAPDKQDGSFSDIEKRFGTTINWNQSFQGAFDAVKAGGDGTIAIIGVQYSGSGSHVIVMANDKGKVGIVEGQTWGPTQPKGVIDNPAAANARYNPDGKSNVGFGIIPPAKKP